MKKWVILTFFVFSFSSGAASFELTSDGYQLRLEIEQERGIWKNGDIVKSWYFKKANPCDLMNFSPFGHLISAFKPWIQKKPSKFGEVRINHKTYYLKNSYKDLPGFFKEVEKVNMMILKTLKECS